VLMLRRAATDYRAWLLVLAALTLGFAWNLKVDAVLKPAIVTVIYVWLAWLMAVPGRWRALLEACPAPAAATGQATAIVAEQR
jgi:hypothetical protein